MKAPPIILIATWLMLAVTTVRAGVTMSLVPTVQNSASGETVVFSVTLTNTGTTEQVFLNDIQFALTGSAATYLVTDTNTFFANVPGILLPGETYTGEIFSVALSGAAPAGDYAGIVTLLGGADVFATGNLASANFKLLSSAVTIAATDPSASEFGPDTGTFTITRTGGTDVDLPVSFAISGTAANGTTYQTIATSTTITAGLSSTAVTITPIPDNLAEGDRNAVLTITASALYNLGASVTDTVIIHDKPADAWRLQHFCAAANTFAAANSADYDGDGIPNLLEYALNLNPKLSDAGALPPLVVSGGYLTLSYVPNTAATDLTYMVESSTDLVTWSITDVEDITTANPNPPGLRTFRYKYPLGEISRIFLRLQVTRQ